MTSRRSHHEAGRGFNFLALAWMVISFLVLPISVSLPISLTDTRFLALPEHGLSLQHWARFLTSEYWLAGIWANAR